MRSIRDIGQLAGIPVLVRAALNEPVERGVVSDTFRLARVLPTLRYLANHGARTVVISHIDEVGALPSSVGAATLAPVAQKLGELTGGVSFCDQTIGATARAAVRALAPGGIVVLENLRRNRGEVMNELAFAKELALLADTFVEDSFDTCHRAHASIVTLPTLLPSYAGLELEAEVKELTAARAPKRPSLAVIGGAKFSTKESVLDALLARYDKVFVGGALANDFFAAQGYPVGGSLVSADGVAVKKFLTNPKLVLPIDSRVAKRGQAPALARVAPLSGVLPDDVIFDHGPATEALLNDLVGRSSQVLWNGPLGQYENGYTAATEALAQAIAESRAYSVVGGGDTITAIESLHILDRFSFASIGGGAMLDYLAAGTLPGIEALG